MPFKMEIHYVPRGCSSVGRALRSQRRGRQFDPDQLHSLVLSDGRIGG